MNSPRPEAVPLARTAVPLARVQWPRPVVTIVPSGEALPAGPIPRRRLRALVPLATGGLAWALVPWLTGLEALLIGGVVGGLGAFATWRADARSPRDGWQRTFPGVSLRGVRNLPRSEESVRALARVCLEVSRGLEEERELRGGLRGWWRGRRVRRQLRALPRHAAALAVQLERLSSIDDPRLERRRTQLREQLEDAVPLAQRLRTNTARATPDPLDRLALRDLDAAERLWSAELDSADELEHLENTP